MMTEPQFKLSRVKGAPVSDDELLTDLKRVANSLGLKTVQQKKYGEVGTYDYKTVIRRFGSWNKGLIAAGLSISNEINISDEKLFENLLILWQHYGRQPRRSELAKVPSRISQGPYNRRFGSWTSSLKAFINYANSREIESPKQMSITNISTQNIRFPKTIYYSRIRTTNRYNTGILEEIP